MNSIAADATVPSSAVIYYEGRAVAEGAIASLDDVEARVVGGHEGLLAGMFVEVALIDGAAGRHPAVVLESTADGVRLRLEDAGSAIGTGN